MTPEELIAHRGFVRSLARSLIWDENQAADVEQQTWMAALQHPPAREKPVLPWLAAVTRNFAFRFRRAEKRRLKHEQQGFKTGKTSTPEEIVIEEEARQKLIQTVLDLDDPYRTAITLRYYDGAPPREIAKHLNLPVGTVHTHIKRGLEKLRRTLDESSGGSRKAWTVAIAPLAGLNISAQAATVVASTSPLLPGILAMSLKLKIGIALFAATIMVFSVFMLLPDKPKGDPGLLNVFQTTAEDKGEWAAAEETEAADPEKRPFEKTTALESRMLNIQLAGRIVNRLSDSPIEHAQISAHPLPHEAEDLPQESLSDSSGAFVLSVPVNRDRPVAFYDLRITAPGFKVLETAIPCEGFSERIDCGIFYLRSDPVFEIQILNIDHQPLTRAEMKLFAPGANVPYLTKSADQKGLIRISDQEVEKKVWRYHTNTLQVSAPGWADYFREIEADENPPFPEEIVLEPVSYWSGRVVDSETLAGLGGIEVSISPKRIRLFQDPIGLRSCVTDGSGFFSIAVFDFHKQWDPRLVEQVANIQVYCEGYLPRRELISIYEDLPELVKMDRAPVLKNVTLFQGQTGDRLPELAIKIMQNFFVYTVTTDAQGGFLLPLVPGRKTALEIHAPGFETFRADLFPETMGDNPYLITLSPIVRHAFEFVVTSDSGAPLAGTRVDLFSGTGAGKTKLQSGRTDQSGKLSLSASMSDANEIYVKCTRRGYYLNELRKITPVEGRSSFHRLIMHKGILFQNVRVLDERGQPMLGANVVALLNLDDGTETSVDEFTDNTGYVDLSLPPFKDGKVYVYQRENVAEMFTYTDILEGKSIVLTLPGGAQAAGSIHGLVMDEEGRPLEMIWLKCFQENSPRKPGAEYYRTKRDGTFRIPAFQDSLYSIRFGHPWSANYSDGYCYLANDLTNLRAGADLKIVMARYPCLMIDLKTMKDRYDRAMEYDLHMENEAGWALKVKEIVRTNSKVFFLDPPSGKVRIIVSEPTRGLLIRSNLIELKAGKLVTGSTIQWEE